MLGKLSPARLAIIIIALIAITASWVQLTRTTTGLIVEDLTVEEVPLRFVGPAETEAAPSVVIAHGFAGSRQLMLAYSYTFAHAGYNTILLDFDGHAANPKPLAFEENSSSRGSLLDNLDVAYEALLAQPTTNPEQVAILGHSMGSGAALSAGIAHPERYAAVIAISPTDAPVTPDLPRNLQLQAGALEAPFIARAEQLFAASEGPNDELASGRGREFTVIPNVEHITILFSPESHQTALNWLNRVFHHDTAAAYQDRRIFIFILHLLAVLLMGYAFAPALTITAAPLVQAKRPWRTAFLAPLLAALPLALLNLATPLNSVGGFLVGGGLSLWFLAMGLLWLMFTIRPTRPQLPDFLWGLWLFALLTAAFGLMAHVVWLPWFLIPTRLWRFPFLAIALLPWLLTLGYTLAEQSRGRWWLWWLGQSIFLIIGLLFLTVFVRGMGFIILIIPLLPVILGLMMIGGATVSQRPWAFALGNAAFFGWLLATLFPLAA